MAHPEAGKVTEEILKKYGEMRERHVTRLNLTEHLFDLEKQATWDIPDKLVIGLAGYGVFVVRKQNPNQPITPAEVLREYLPCIDLGAIAVHTHARTAEGHISDVEPARSYLRQVIDPLRTKYGDKIVLDGGIGYYGKTFEDTVFPVLEGMYEVALVHPCPGVYGDMFRFYSPESVRAEVELCERLGVKPMLDIHDTSDIDTVRRWLLEPGLLSRPTYWHLLSPMGAGSIYSPNVEAMIDGLLYLVRRIKELDKNAVIIVSQGGRPSLYYAVQAILMGLHVRIGMEDAIYKYPHKNELIKNNLEITKAVVEVARNLGREPATADEYRKILGLR